MNQALNINPVESLLTQHQQSFDTLAGLLIEENKHTNLTRIVEPEQIRVRHFLDSMAALPLLDRLAEKKSLLKIVDVGSGAGFPVLPLAIVRPDWRFVSIEATGKKVKFQEKTVAALGLRNVSIVHARAEELAHRQEFREQFDAAVARAVAELRILAELSLGFIKIGGLMLAFKGSDIQHETAAAQSAITLLGGQIDAAFQYSISPDSGGFCLIQIKKNILTPDYYPRPYSILSRQLPS